ncbi:MAG: hypothetical protein KatS3mg102_0682 [Planctomycetota bacterium]|nr:MAG: hypothetical protein KatS3mg102_0682 [Planctomycetota bacterium]
MQLLLDTLGAAARRRWGEATVRLAAELHDACASGDLEAAARRLEPLDDEQIVRLVRHHTALFHLVNQAEQQEIIRINRERARAAGGERPESIAAAVGKLRAAGLDLEQALACVRRLDIQPTLTAHPTEARRPSVLFQQQRIGALLAALEGPEPTPGERQETPGGAGAAGGAALGDR